MAILGTQQRSDPGRSVEPERQRAARLKAEALMLAVASADIQNSRVIDDTDIDAWLDGWERGVDVALPDRPVASPKL